TAPNGAGTTDVNGEIAAYYYITAQALPGQAINAHQCTIPGEPGYGPYNTTYGIRCTYTQPGSVNLLNTCTNAAEAQIPPSAPQPYNPNNTSLTATITLADWKVVGFQLAQECTYAGSTLNVYGVYQTVLDNIFNESKGDINNLATLIGTTHTVNVAPTTLLEGMVYTILSAGSTYAGGKKGLLGGIFANLMQTTVDYAQARKGNSPLNTTLAATSQTLYTQMDNAMQSATTQMGNQVQEIVWSWQRLKQAGPLMTQDGPNGLDLTFGDESSVTATGVAAYETMFLQTFFPEAYALQLEPGRNGNSGFGPAADITYTYPTFGSSSGSWNASFLCQLTTATKDCPNAALMTSPEPLPAQSRFALFNGLNGWSSLARTSPTMDYSGAMIVLFNATPNTLSVTVSTLTGIIASPGQDFVNGWGQCCILGSGNPYSAQLFPYGYVPIYGAANGAGQYIFSVSAYSGALPVAQLQIENASPAGTKTPWVMTATTFPSTPGWSLYPAGGKYTHGSPNVQEPILTKNKEAKQSTPATMWLVIQQ
ncbi:MAG TPA: hypothetical protein VK760_06705, partial [Candidatus Acidoferrales bacterium]|nr:hypothetical protein [Candidatus Acidoferrales bacterium]